MTPRRLVRCALVGAALAWGLPVTVASCAAASTSSGTPVVADASVAAAVPEAAPEVAPPPVDAAPCDPVPSSRCTGFDKGFVFFPPALCDGGACDAGAKIAFTPAACRAFAAAEACGRVSFEASAEQPSFTEPVDGASLMADDWTIFAWKKGAAARAPTPIGRWLEPSAHAATPLDGDGYVIVFTQGATEVIRAMTAVTYWEPDPESWSTLVSTVGPMTVRVYWSKFGADGIVRGPAASAPITITMKR